MDVRRTKEESDLLAAYRSSLSTVDKTGSKLGCMRLILTGDPQGLVYWGPETSKLEAAEFLEHAARSFREEAGQVRLKDVLTDMLESHMEELGKSGSSLDSVRLITTGEPGGITLYWGPSSYLPTKKVLQELLAWLKHERTC